MPERALLRSIIRWTEQLNFIRFSIARSRYSFRSKLAECLRSLRPTYTTVVNDDDVHRWVSCPGARTGKFYRTSGPFPVLPIQLAINGKLASKQAICALFAFRILNRGSLSRGIGYHIQYYTDDDGDYDDDASSRCEPVQLIVLRSQLN